MAKKKSADYEEYEKWFERAETDLRTARNSSESGDYYASIFWCQQAVEKGLKALWISRDNELVKIHDLVVLGKKVDLPDDFFEDAAKLSGLYTGVRYIPVESFKEEETRKFIKFGEEVLKWIKKKI